MMFLGRKSLTKLSYYSALVAFALALIVAAPSSARAATLCVNPGGTGTCKSSINTAIQAASPGDTILVAQGVYGEDVQVDKSVSIVGSGPENTIIDATAQNNGIYIDGLDNANLSDVTITGFTVENAKFEGILAQNASDVTIWGNVVRDNDQDLSDVKSSCTPPTPVSPRPIGCVLPAFETNEADDAGEGIHFIGMDHSIIADNTVEHNAGGILNSDETAPDHDDVITGNTVEYNAYDCGITTASHSYYKQGATTPANHLAFGIYHNTISDNLSLRNGFGGSGGAGIGLFAPGPGNMTTDISVVGNRLIDNAQPGVAIHNHATDVTVPNVGPLPNPILNDNAIVGNYFSGNGPDPDLSLLAPAAAVPTAISVLGVTPVTGLVISGNVIKHEKIGVAVSSASEIAFHLNNMIVAGAGVDALNASGTIDATENWWGCSRGPGAAGCSSVSAVSGATVFSAPWLTQPVGNGAAAGSH